MLARLLELIVPSVCPACDAPRAVGDELLCLGCARSIEEIVGWASFTAEGRRTIMAELAGRSQAMAPAARRPDENANRQEQRPGTAPFADAS